MRKITPEEKQHNYGKMPGKHMYKVCCNKIHSLLRNRILGIRLF